MTDPADPKPAPQPLRVIDRRGVEPEAPAVTEPAPAPAAPANDDAPAVTEAAAEGPDRDVVCRFVLVRRLLPDGSLRVEIVPFEGDRPLGRPEAIGMLLEAVERQRAEFVGEVTTAHLARASRLAIPAPPLAGLRGPRG